MDRSYCRRAAPILGLVIAGCSSAGPAPAPEGGSAGVVRSALDGAVSWSQAVGAGSPSALTTDASGNVYVVAQAAGANVVTMLDPSGNVAWTQTITPDSGTEAYAAIVPDGSGDVALAGNYSANGASGVVTSFVGSDGSLWWTSRSEGGLAFGGGLAVTSQDTVVTASGGAGALAIAYDGYGDQDWRFADPGSAGLGASALRVRWDGSQYLTIAGTAKVPSGSSTTTVEAVWRTDVYGFPVWSWTGALAGGYEISRTLRDVAVDAGGNTYVVSRLARSGGEIGTKLFGTTKLDPRGNVAWQQADTRYSDGDEDDPNAIALDAQGNVTVSGYSGGHTLGKYFKSVQYDPAGAVRWGLIDNFGNTYIAWEKASGQDSAGDTCMTGTLQASPSAKQALGIVSYDGTGRLRWRVSSGDYGPSAVDPRGGVVVASGSAGNVVVTRYAAP